jgi:hypothetical protein
MHGDFFLQEIKLQNSEEQLRKTKLNLKRTKSREVYTREKLPKLEENTKEPVEKTTRHVLRNCSSEVYSLISDNSS